MHAENYVREEEKKWLALETIAATLSSKIDQLKQPSEQQDAVCIIPLLSQLKLMKSRQMVAYHARETFASYKHPIELILGDIRNDRHFINHFHSLLCFLWALFTQPATVALENKLEGRKEK